MNSEHKNPSLAVMQRNAAKAEAMLKQLANAKRLMILCSLVSGEKSVGELADIVGLSSSALSQHLAKMREAELVSYEKRGQMVYYRISSMEAQALLSTLYLIYCKN
jgi:ArsR family transcriptional regulator, virulence genes transcriptional regulator